MRYGILAACLLGIFALPVRGIYCSCLRPEVPLAFSDARAVFVGEVTEILRPRTADPKAPPEARLYLVKFRVERAWKGVVVSQELTLLSDQGRAGCFSWGSFLKGGRYLVYAEDIARPLPPRSYRFLKGEGDLVYTEERTKGEVPIKSLAVLFSCNRTTPLANASEDLKKLEKMSKPSFKFNCHDENCTGSTLIFTIARFERCSLSRWRWLKSSPSTPS